MEEYFCSEILIQLARLDSVAVALGTDYARGKPKPRNLDSSFSLAGSQIVP